MEKEYKKPPLGIIPRNIALEKFDQERLMQLRDVILNYVSESAELPMDFVLEYNGIIVDQKYRECQKQERERANG